MFDLMEYVRFTQTAVDGNSYRESEHQGSALIVELVALSLASGELTERSATPPPDEAIPLTDAVQEILDLGHELFSLVAARGQIAVENGDFDPTTLVHRATERALFVRGSTYEHIINEVLTALFGTPEMEALCRRVVGFTGGEACRLFVAIRERCDESIREIRRRMGRFEAFRQSIAGTTTNSGRDIENSGPQERPAHAMLLDAVDKIWFPVPATSTFDAADLAAATGISATTVEHFLTVFCFRATEAEPGAAVEQAVQGSSPLRVAPILRDGDRCFMTHCSFGLHVVREAIELRLGGSPDWQPYQKPRGDFLEDASLKLLTQMLPSAQVHDNLHYFVPDDDKWDTNEPPERYTKLCEGDGLLIIDDTALIVEAKSRSLRPESRSGDGLALKRDLDKIIRGASDQAERLHKVITKDGRIRVQDGSWIDASGIREVIPIALSLEDLSGFATAAAGLLRERVISIDYVPWMVSLYDLHVISDIVQHPAELILYLRRRANPDIIRNYFAYDELDYFMRFLDGELLSGNESHQTRLTVPRKFKSANQSRNLRNREPMKFLGSHTEPLDNWYMFEHGGRTAPARRPELTTEPRVRAMTEALAEQQPPGWLNISAALLDYDLRAQAQIADDITGALDQTRADGCGRTFSVLVGGPASQISALVVSTLAVGEDVDSAATNLADIAAANKRGHTATGAGLLFRAEDKGLPSLTCYGDWPAGRPS